MLSLRATISALSALSVAIVAVVTLTIAITTSLDALRAIGKRHAASLAANANALVESRFRHGSDAVNGMIRLGRSRRWNYPSEDNTTVEAFRGALKQAFFDDPQALSSAVLFFSDNTQLWLTLFTSSYDEPSNMSEVRALQQAYFEMNDELNRIRSFVPQTVLMAKRAEAQGIDPDLDATPTNEDSNSHRSSTKGRVRRGSLWGDRASASGAAHTPDHLSTRDSGSNAIAAGALGVRVTNATVLLGNLSGLHAAAVHATTEQLANGIHDAVTVFGSAVGSRGGVLSFHGDRFFASFNAVVPCATHARRAVDAALEINESIAAVGLKLPAHVGVATGTFTVGGFGSDSVKAMCVIGPAVAQAAAMERVGREFKCHVLASQRTIADVSAFVDYRYVDLVRLPSRDGSLKPALVAEVIRRQTQSNSMRGATGDAEWLYIVGDGHGGAAAARNKVFEELANGDAAKAAELYEGLPRDEAGGVAAAVPTEPLHDGLARALYGAAMVPV